MLEIYDLKDKQQYIHEVAMLTYNEWGKKLTSKVEREQKI